MKISSPAGQSTVNKSSILVKGDFYNAFGETGVTVKDAGLYGEVLSFAQRNGSVFAGVAPLQEGLNTLTVIASDVCRQKAVDVVKINTTQVPEPLRLSVRPASGVLSATGFFQAVFEADASLLAPIASYSWDFNGDGVLERTGKDLSRVTADYNATGLYFPQVTVTDTAGNTYSETTVVNVQSRVEMDALLKGKWAGVKSELAAGNVKKALRYISERAQKMYQYNYELMSIHLPEIANDMGQVTLVNIIGDTAEYDLTATQEGRATSFFVQFVRDSDGIWRLKFY